jgi:hypothetical protein
MIVGTPHHTVYRTLVHLFIHFGGGHVCFFTFSSNTIPLCPLLDDHVFSDLMEPRLYLIMESTYPLNYQHFQ